MTSRYSATITVENASKDAGPAAILAIYESIKTDESFYPDNPVKTAVASDGSDDGNRRLVITSESDNLAHLRANLNSTLRLVQASYTSIAESAAR